MNPKVNPRLRKFLHGITISLVIFPLWVGMSGTIPVQAARPDPQIKSENTQIQRRLSEPFFVLDGVLVSVQSSSLPSVDFVVSEPGSTSQVATSVTWKPYYEFSVLAVPFRSKPGIEAIPVAGPGLKSIYEDALRSYRIQQGGIIQAGSSISLFGQEITGSRSLVYLNIDNPVPTPVEIEEWVVEAGDRLWIIRSSKELVSGLTTLESMDSATDIVLTSDNLDQPTTILNQTVQPQAMNLNQDITAANLPTPSWWQGDCDTTTYYNSTGFGAYPLGAVYLGAPACGPRPAYDKCLDKFCPDVLVRFFPGSWGVFEWECVEYSMRFLYLRYGIAPYQANGYQVVWNYSGSQLVKISNGTVGIAPKPDDVLSYGSTSTSGHTSIVTASNVNGAGNGTLTVIEENASVSGSSTLTVTNWWVAGNAGAVSGWLTSNPPPLLISISKNGNGSGLVSSVPTGIDCGSTCSYAFAYNSSITLTASADSGSVFTGWSGAGCSGAGTCVVAVNTAKSINATFARLPFAYTDITVYHGGAWMKYDFNTGNQVGGVWTGKPSPGCIPALIDYDGDGVKEYSQLCDGAWLFYNDNGTLNKGIWTGGLAGDLPVPGDYNGDGTDEVVVWHNGAWLFFNFSTGVLSGGVWTGAPTYNGMAAVPVPMDYDGNGTTDFTVYGGGPWLFYNSNGTLNKGIWTGGVAGDLPVPGDYNGDGTDEVVVWHSGAWLIFNFNNGVMVNGVWTGAPMFNGMAALPAPLDYDKDGGMDYTTYSGGSWLFYNDNGTLNKGIWAGGVTGDLPISRRYLP